MTINSKYFYGSSIKGFSSVKCGCWSLLIEHPSGRKLLYDLGMRKDYSGCAPASGVSQLVEKGVSVANILVEGDIDLESIDGVIWSHYHFDHSGELAAFPTVTKLIVGEGTKEIILPGYPANPKAPTLASDIEGREVLEIKFDGQATICGFRAYDYFGDGSLYLLDTPGHCVGHLNALARTSVNPPEFIHMCGDSAHHCGEIRPSFHVPLPDDINPSPLSDLHQGSCPCGVFSTILRNGSKDDHILEAVASFVDEHEFRKTIKGLEVIDAADEVLTVLAHDWTLKGIIDEWPKALNGWKAKGWKAGARWKFLGDFKAAGI
ncbi:hypothetical protein PRZ48_005508 [Zasmidium cellare]|uniref:Metallo-beta-lactamase domain-containing protein n=1 Tax=Zasmidium cellare TaxID=395010 RepID=A0ABR0ESY0_ZASCE|nr:hypothetical protein PRZ48_005508 [Zasmidium cellare]